MIHAGALDLICDINPAELEQASRLVNAKNITDLVKCYGPTDESLLMTFCCQKNDSPALRAQIFAFLSRVLEESNDDAIDMIIKKNSAGLSALDYATMANNAKIAAFLGEMFKKLCLFTTVDARRGISRSKPLKLKPFSYATT